MAVDIAQAYISILPETSKIAPGVKSALGDAEKSANSTGTSMGSKISSGLGTTLKAGALATGAAAGGALALAMGKGFGRLSNIDQAQAKLRGLGHDADSVSAIMESANAAVKGTAFGLDEAASTAASAVAAGIAPGAELQRTLTLMGDAATIAGTDMSTMGSIVNKVATSDMMQMDVANQLMDAGIPILQMVGKEMGVTAEEARKMASEGKINFETFQNALEGGLGGAAQESGQTFKGAFANMQAALGRFGAKLLEPVFKAAPPVFEKIGAKLDELGKVAGPFAENLANIVGPVVIGAFNGLLDVVGGVVGAIKGLVDFGQRNQSWILPMASAVGVLAGAFGLLVVQQKLMAAAAAVQAAGGLLAWMSKLTAVTKIQTAAQTALNLVMNANPIFLIVTAIAAVAAALWAFFTKTETGRQIWENFTQAIGSAWDWVKNKLGAGIEWIKTAFSGLKSLFVEGDFTGALRQAFGIEEDSPIVGFFLNLRDTVMQAFDFITAKLAEFGNGFMQFYSTWIQPVVGFISESFLAVVSALTTAFQFLGEIVTTVWTGAIVPAFQFLGQIVTSIWTGIIQPALSFFMSMLTALGQTVMSVVQAMIVPVWNFLGAQISNIYNNLIKPIFGFFRSASGLLADVLTGNFSNIRNRFSEMGQAIAGVVRGVITAAMNTFKNIVRMVGDAWNNFRGVVSNVVSAVSGKVQEMVGKITAIPGKIQSAFASAGSWLRNAGTNLIQGFADGIRAAGGWIVDAIKSLVPSQLHHFLPFMDGGFFFANGGTTEKHEAQIARAGAWRVWAEPETGGEAYIPLSPAKRKRSTQILATVADRFGLSLTGNDGQPLPAAALGKVRATGRAFANGGITNPHDLLRFAKGERVNGKQARRSLQGAPYVWGGSNWGDCSGAMSQFAAAVSNAGDWFTRKFATGGQGAWLTQHGFKHGMGSGPRLVQGFFNGGSYGGHTSGTIFFGDGKRVNIEMGGGAGGQGKIGGAAAGADHPQYTDRYHYPLKGAGARGRNLRVTGTSTEGVTVESDAYKNETIDWGTANDLFTQIQKDRERSSKLKRFRAGLFDTGGVLPHNTVALNRSGKPEVVINNNQLTAINKLANNVGALVPELATLVRRGQIGGATRALGQTVRTGEYVAAAGLSKNSALVDAAKNVHVMFKNVIAMATTMKVDDYIALGEKLGLKIVTDLVKGVAGAYTKLEDSWVAQVDAADGLKQAEDNLVKARKNYADVVKKDGATSDAAKAAKEELTKAELDLADARSVVTAAAAATGHAEVAMVIEIIDAVVSLIGQITSAVFKARIEVFKAVSSMMGSIGELSDMLQKQRALVTGLRLDMALAEIEVANAARNLRLSQIDGARAQLEAITTVAEAQAAFDKQRRVDAALALADYTDLSLAFDRFRWAMKSGLDDAMIDMAAWSDESHALWAELMAAQIGQQIAEKTAQINNLKAAYEHTKAVMDLADVTRSLGVASEKLAVMTGVAFGYDNVEATVGQRYAQLAQEKAEIEAGKADAKNWLNPAAWFTYYPQANRRIEQINAEMAEIAKMDEFKSFDQGTLREIDKLLAGAGALGFFGGADQIANMVNWSALGDAGRALDKVKWQQDLIDTKAEREALAAEIAEKQSKLDYESQLAPLETLLESLQARQGAEKTWAEYWRSEDAGVREALMALAQFQADSADSLQQMANNPTVVTINMPANKTAYTPEEVQAMLAELNAAQRDTEFRVNRLENPPVSGAQVAANRKVVG